jgi:hypothetical protein
VPDRPNTTFYSDFDDVNWARYDACEEQDVFFALEDHGPV